MLILIWLAAIILFLVGWARFQNHVKGKDLMDITYKQSERDYPKGEHIPK